MDSPRSTPSRWATEVHRGPGFILGRFDLPADADAWREENWIGRNPHIVFPRTALLISKKGRDIVSDPNLVVLYAAEETYRREAIDPQGDHSFYAELSPELVEDIGTSAWLAEDSNPIDSAIYALQWRTVRLYETGDLDGLVLDEAILAVLAVVIGGIAPPPDTPGQRRTVERTKRILNETMSKRMSLQDIASEVHVSPYHLTRLFRRHTGMPLHAYRTELRLRRALGRLEKKSIPLSDIAREVGFSSHSHFSRRFRARFGFTPLEWREEKPHPCSLFAEVGTRT